MIKLFCFCLFLSNFLQSQEAMMIQALNIIKNTFEVSYAPTEWKGEWSGWSLNQEIESAQQKIQGKNLSLKEFHQVLKEFFNSTQDYHTGIRFYSTEHAYLPFSVRGANGRYFIVSIYSKEDDFPFSVGDELVSFNERPTHEEVTKIREQNFWLGNDRTDFALAAELLTNRHGSHGQIIPKGDINFTIRSKLTGTESEYTFTWIYYPEKITPTKRSHSFSQTTLRERFLATVKNKLLYQGCKALNEDDDDKEKMGFLPSLGRKVWAEKTNFFNAYIFETLNNKRIGYIRIPDFLGSDEEAEEFGNLMSFFEEESAALVIDQLDNPGGSLYYLHAITAMLINKPIKTYKHKINITQMDVMVAIDYLPRLDEIRTDDNAIEFFGNFLDGMEVNLQVARSFQSYYKNVLKEWESGNSTMAPFYLMGLEWIEPNDCHQYTKPIIILTNELNFSAADFFPALMQDSQRAVILGTQTAGAGGVVQQTTFPNLLGIEAYWYTGSIAERNGSVIENLGVTPDIYNSVSENDLQYDYSDYVKKILETVEMIVK